MSFLQPFWIALQFLTVLPTPLKHAPSLEATGRSLAWYPLVGLLLGSILATLGWIGEEMPTNLHAALLLATWVALTGALHLDGLGDSADAWVGGLNDREKTLAIMKDPRSGPAAITVLVLLLMVKFAALEAILGNGEWVGLILAPLLGRAAALLLFLTTPYVRAEGQGTPFSRHSPRRSGTFGLVASAALTLSLVGIGGLWVLASVTVLFMLLRRALMRRIGGTTGDTAGAVIELTEATVLATLATLQI